MVFLCLLMYWVSEIVTVGAGISPNNIAVDSRGNPHILVLARNENVPGYIYYLMLYSKNRNGTWDADTFETHGGEPLGINGDIVIDCFDRIWVVYKTGSQPGDIKYLVVACKDKSGWVKDTVDSGYTFYCQSITADSDGHPHVVYDNLIAPHNPAFYAYFDGYSWTKELFDTMIGNFNCSVDVDSHGTPHISYYSYDIYTSQDNLWYATKPDEWSYDEVDITYTSWFRSTSIRVGPDNLPGIAYTDPGIDEELKYAYYDGNAWNIDTIELYGGLCNSQKALDKDSLGQPYIVYAWGYKTWIAYKNTEWHKELLPESSINDSYGSVRIDKNGVLHIARISRSVDYQEIWYIYGNVGIEEDVKEEIVTGIKVYPNPFSNKVIITSKKSEVDIYDISGRLVDSFSLQGTVEWNTSSLSSGIYFLRFKTENSVITKKLVKR